MFFFCLRKAQVTFEKRSQLKIKDIVFKLILNPIKLCKGTFVNRELPSLHGMSHEITSTVPLKFFDSGFYNKRSKCFSTVGRMKIRKNYLNKNVFFSYQNDQF